MKSIKYLYFRQSCCVACEVRMTHTDHDSSVVIDVVSSLSAASHFWFQIDNSCREALIPFKLYRRIMHHRIQVKFDKGGNLQNFD